MAVIGYHSILTTVKSTIGAALGSAYNVTAGIAQPMETKPWVAVYLDSRTDPPDQPIDAGRSQRYQIQYSIWCWCWSVDNGEQAAEDRDDLIDLVENVLLNNRRLGGAVENGTLHGGQFEEAQDDAERYVSGGEIIFRVIKTAVRT